MTRSPLGRGDGLAIAACASVGAALAGATGDALVREGCGQVHPIAHVLASTSLLLADVFPLGAVALAGVAVARMAERRLGATRVRVAVAITTGMLVAVVAARATVATASVSSLGAFFSPSARAAAAALLGLAAAAGIALALYAVRRAEKGPLSAAATWGAAFAVVAATAETVDLTCLVSLYSRSHLALERVSELAWIVTFTALACIALRRRPSLRLAGRVVALCCLVACGVYEGSASWRSWHERVLSHVWREPVLVGRVMLRVRSEALHGPAARTEALARRFDIEETSLARAWVSPYGVPHREARELNVVVYFVDTLRADVASSSVVMPSYRRFAESALEARHAYSTGSDTLHGLPSLVGGRHDARGSSADLLAMARRHGMRTCLFIPTSSHEYLERRYPSFRFDETERVADYDAARTTVWGYGADRPTAHEIVDRAVAWIGAHARSDRFVAWVHQYDLHNWREMESARVEELAKRYDVREEGEWNWQYRVMARHVDEQFGRLLAAIEDAGVADRTIIVFASDHGEGLGYRGFWVHSVFLWESLVRVPLAIRVPGMSASVHAEPASVVDLAPTLAALLEPGTSVIGAHGQSLFDRRRRRLPVVMAATAEGETAQVALVDGGHKLVVPLDGSEPQLVDLSAEEPDETDRAAVEPRRVLGMMNDLVRSPVLPRASRGDDDDDERATTAWHAASQKRRIDDAPP